MKEGFGTVFEIEEVEVRVVVAAVVVAVGDGCGCAVVVAKQSEIRAILESMEEKVLYGLLMV